MTEHHSAPEIVVHRDHDDYWKRIGLVDDYGQKIELSLAQLHRPGRDREVRRVPAHHRAPHAADLTLKRQKSAATVNKPLTVAADFRTSGAATGGQLRADRAVDLTRGGGPYACARIGLASRLPAFAQ